MPTLDRTFIETFTVTEDHLKLARRMVVGWCGDEYGAPEINPKRPYGNSDVTGDIADILGWEDRFDPTTGEPLPEVLDRARAIHEQMKTALQIFLATGSFETGDYEADRYFQNWRKSERRTP